MKNTYFLFLLLFLTFTLASCGSHEKDDQYKKSDIIQEQKSQDKMEDKMMKKEGDLVEKGYETEEKYMQKDEIVQEKLEESKTNEKVSTTQEAMKKGIYTTYSQDLLKSGTGDIVLFFSASWCPSCVAIDSNLKKDSIPENLTILKVNYDDNLDLKKKYGVNTQHTFVQVNSSGSLINKWVGGNDLDDIKSNLK